MRRLFATSLLLLAALALASGPRSARADEGAAAAVRRPLILVVASDSPVANLSIEELRRIFGGDSLAYRPLNLAPGAEERVALDRILFGRGPDEMARYWIDRKIRGQAGPPRVIPTGRLVARIVARVPQAIGYLFDDALPPGTKAIRVNGLASTDPRYPLLIQTRRSR